MSRRTPEYAIANLTTRKVVEVGRALHLRENTPEKVLMLEGLAELCERRARRYGDVQGTLIRKLGRTQVDNEIRVSRTLLGQSQRDDNTAPSAASGIDLLLADDRIWEILSAGRGFGLEPN